ncbi:glycosyltransferase family 2 protein [Priestia filamentosa]|uniref:glycosyltransferase family 2 protein n=1 Tax=Priestia filamentosa TaxID=1402861 RepID=UPI00397E840D
MTKDFALVSVVVPCFLSTKTIRRAVSSIWNQTLRPAEVILVDDCSPDSGQTLKTLYDIQKEYPEDWVKVVPLSMNKGPGNARNIGWDKATQPYIAFLDSDDSWHPRKIELQYVFMKENQNITLSGHDFLHLDEKKQSHPSLKGKYSSNQVSSCQLLLSNKFPTPSVMLKSSIPYRFDPAKKYSEDYLLWLQITLNNNEVWKIDLPLTYIYKAPFGEGGLSGNLWRMEKGELNTYSQLRKQKLISRLSLYCLTMYSLAKYAYRCIFKKKFKNPVTSK